MRKQKQTWVALAVLLAISGLAFWRWLSFEIFTYADWWYQFAPTLRDLFYPSAWISSSGLGSPNLLLWRWPLEFVHSLFGLAGMDLNIADKLTVLWPSVFLLTIAGFLLVKKVTESNLGAITGTLVIVFNTYFLASATQGHNLIVVASAFGLLAFWLYLEALEQHGRVHYYLLCSLALFFTSVYDFRIFYIFLGILGAYFLYYVIVLRKGDWGLARRQLWLIVPVLLMNSYWLLPSILSGSLNDNDILGRSLFGTQYWNLKSSIALSHPFWNGSEPAWFQLQPVPLIAWLIPVIALVGIVLNRFDKRLLFFVGIACAGILLSKQTDAPFTQLYTWLYAHIPGFSSFREPTKFYVLTVLGYGILIGAFTAVISRKAQQLQPWQKNLSLGTLLIIVALPMAVNAAPLVSGAVGTMFKPQTVPDDYVRFKELLEEQPAYFRTLWLPRDSRWSFYTNSYPKLSGAEIVEKNADFLVDDRGLEDIEFNPRLFGRFFSQSFSGQLLNTAAVKYVVVPIQEPRNTTGEELFDYYGSREEYLRLLDNTPYLKKLDSGFKQLAVYENKSYMPFVSVSDNLVQIDSYQGFSNKTNLARQLFNGESYHVARNASNASLYSSTLVAPLEGFSLKDGGAKSMKTITDRPNTNIWHKDLQNLIYKVKNGTFSVYYRPAGYLVSGNTPLSGPPKDSLLASQKLSADGQHYVANGTILKPIKKVTAEEQIGQVAKDHKVEVFQANGSGILPNGGFENGTWTTKVGNCNKYDQEPDIGMRLVSGASNNKHVELSARRHTACTSKKIKITNPGNYVLGLSYNGKNAKNAGIFVRFNNPRKTTFSERFNIQSANTWQRQERLITVPANVTEAEISLYAYESDKNARNTVGYDDVVFVPLEKTASIKIPTKSTLYQEAKLDDKSLGKTFKFIPSSSSQNLVANSSFESSMWTASVSDCNNIDSSADIGMGLSEQAYEGKQALELRTKRHIACTSTPIFIKNTGSHFLSFAYKSPSSSAAGYYIEFNDPANSVIKEKIAPNTDKSWRLIRRHINVPPGASEASLFLYSYESDRQKENIVHYDDVQFREMADIRQAAMVVQKPAVSLKLPKQVDYHRVGQSSRLLKISGSKGKFLLTTAESFHTKWKIYISPLNAVPACQSASGAQNTVSTIVKGCKKLDGSPLQTTHLRNIALFDQTHFKVDGYANGWIIDADYIKSSFPARYWRENPDGSIDFSIAVHYEPQSYANLGLAISGATFLGSAIIAPIKSHQKKNTIYRRETGLVHSK